MPTNKPQPTTVVTSPAPRPSDVRVFDIVQVPLIKDYIVETIFPAYELHLVSGPSGSGKSTWLMQFIESWQKGEAVFGHPSQPLPFVYLIADRSQQGSRRTQHRAVPEIDSLPAALVDSTRPILEIFRKVLKQDSKIRVFFIEAMTGLVPGGDPNDYKKVSSWLKEITDFCAAQRVTVIGTVHSPKVKEKEGYKSARDRILGSTAWAGYAETIIDVQVVNQKVDDGRRQLTIMPRNGKSISQFVQFDTSGKLVPYGGAVTAGHSKAYPVFDRYLAGLKPDDRFKFKDIQALIPSVANTTVNNWLKKQVGYKIIRSIDRGCYAKNAHQPKLIPSLFIA